MNWTDERVVEFVNWYLEVQKLPFKYNLENQTLIKSFKNGDKPEVWHTFEDKELING